MSLVIKDNYNTIGIEELNFSSGAFNSLKRAGINTVYDLYSKSDEEIRSIRGCGSAKYTEIIEKRNSLSNEYLDNIIQRREDLKNADFRDIPIDKLGLSLRLHNALKRIGIDTVGQLMQTKESDLRQLRNIGRTSIDELKTVMAAIDSGCNLAEETPVIVEKTVDDYPKKEFDTELLQYLKDNFSFNFQILCDWFGITRQRVSQKLQKRRNPGHWRDRELTDANIESLNQLLQRKVFYLVDGEEKTLFMNNFKGEYAVVFVNSEEVKCFLKEDFSDEICKAIEINRFDTLTEKELNYSIDDGKIIRILKEDHFSPDNPQLFRQMASERRMPVSEYSQFLLGMPYVSGQNSVDDNKIIEFLTANTVAGRTFIPSVSENQWIRSYLSRHGFTTDEFIKFYGFNTAAEDITPEAIDFDDLFESVEEDMEEYECDGEYLYRIFAKNPLIGNELLSEKNKGIIHAKAKKLIDSRVRDSSRRFSLEEEMFVTLSVIEYSKNWISESVENFWSFIAAQYAYLDSSGLVKNIINSCVYDALLKNNRWFVVTSAGYQYKATIVTHAITPRKSWYRFYDFIFDFYINNLNWEYIENDPIIERMIAALSIKFVSDNELDEDIQIGSKCYFFQEGIRKLITLRPHYAAKVISDMIKRIDELIKHVESPAKNYLTVLADDWMKEKIQSLSSNDRRRLSSGERRAIAIDYTRIRATYHLKNDEELIISIPDVRLANSDFRKIHLWVLNSDETIIDDKSIEFYGNELGKTMKGFDISVAKDILRRSVSKRFEFKIILKCDDELIYNSETSLYRDMICFSGNKEIDISDCKKSEYTIFTPSNDNLSVTNAEISEIQNDSIINSWYCQLGDLFTISINDKLMAMESVDDTDGGVSLRCPQTSADITYQESGIRYNTVLGNKNIDIVISNNQDLNKFRLVINNNQISFNSLDSDSIGNNTVFKYVLSGQIDNKYRITIIDLSSGRLLAKKNLYVIDLLDIHFNKPYYFDENDFSEAAVAININNKIVKMQFNKDDKFISIPYLEGDLEIRIPSISIIDNRNIHWSDGNYYWIKDLQQNLFVQVIGPNAVTADFYIDEEKVPYDGAVGYSLGNSLYAYEPEDKNKWVNVYVELSTRYGDRKKYKIGTITYKERFIKKPVLTVAENILAWDKGYGFCGNKQDEIYIEILENTQVIYTEKVDLNSATITNSLTLPVGEYTYSLYKQSSNIFSVERTTLAKGVLYVGNENDLRFKNQRIVIYQATTDTGNASDIPIVDLKTSYIDNIRPILDDEGNQVYEECNTATCPMYTGTLYYVTENSHTRKEYSSITGTTPDGRALLMVNPVKIYYINDSTINITDIDGDGLYYQSIFDREKYKTIYFITDWDPTAPQNRAYRKNYYVADLFSYRKERIKTEQGE